VVSLLPVLDINGALAAALETQRPFRAAPPIAGVFACDPFLRPTDLAARLHRAGIREVVNAPTIQLFDGETAAELGSVGYRAEAEFRLLLRLAELGLEPLACVTSRAAADLALGLGLRRFLLHPGLTPPADPQAWWAELAGHVAIEGGEALLWRDKAK
jgi:predicted TIM-barrel enzyme